MLNRLYQRLPSVTLSTAVGVFLAAVVAVACSYWMQPTRYYQNGLPQFEKLIPREFGEWHEVQDGASQVSMSPYHKNMMAYLYDETLMRTYEDNAGHRIMLALAYAHEQKQEIKIHRPEVCYPAQGFSVLDIKPATFKLASSQYPVQGKTMTVTDGNRYETVSYWIRMGNQYPSGGMQARYAVLKNGLQGTIIDGVLVRVSMSASDLSQASAQFDIEKSFVDSLLVSLTENQPSWLVK